MVESAIFLLCSLHLAFVICDARSLIKADSPWLDDGDNPLTRFSFIKQIADILGNSMNSACASNVVALLCHTAFRECRPAENGAWIPSLLCRSECDQHVNIWNECLQDLEAEPDVYRSFSSQMDNLVR
jgi:hypothetical protein